LVQSFVPQNVVARAPVLSAVGFDHEARLDTSEIDDVGRDRMLPSKTSTELVVPQHIPQQFLRFCRVPAQTASAPNDRRATTHVPTAPLSREILPYPPCRRKTSQAPTLTLPRQRGRESPAQLLHWRP